MTLCPAVLDHPVWSALTGPHRAFAEGNSLVWRYPPEMGTFAALRENSPECVAELARLMGPGGRNALATTYEVSESPGVSVERKRVCQMVAPGSARPAADRAGVRRLGVSDVAEMIALVELTNPGPFRTRTIEFGGYYGIHRARKLVAMAGQRMRLPGYTEVSGVCTHPDYRGSGFSTGLIELVEEDIRARGDRPFLHVFDENVPAIRVYEKMGYVTRRILHFGILTRE